MLIRLLSFVLISFVFFNTYSQHDEWYYQDEIIDEGMEAILLYEKFNPLVSGDSARICGTKRCNGTIIDNYPNERIMHKGYYTNGQLLNGYENYFENEQLERKYRVPAPNKASLVVYFSSGEIRSEVEFLKGEILMWKDYYPNGNIEYWEEYDKSLKYYVTYNFYYMNGNPQSTMTLLDKKDKIYDAAEYYPSGVIKEKGQKRWTPGIGGYVSFGNWEQFDSEGNIIKTVYYHMGEELDDDDFDFDFEEEEEDE